MEHRYLVLYVQHAADQPAVGAEMQPHTFPRWGSFETLDEAVGEVLSDPGRAECLIIADAWTWTRVQ